MQEGVLDADEAARRVHEVLHVAVDGAGSLAGVSTAFVAPVRQLRMDLWHFRAFVAAEHRRSSIALDLLRAGRHLLEQRFVSGADRRAAGMVLVVENDALKRHQPHGDWRRGGVSFIGEDERGAWMRVRYFPGAMAPMPDAP